jgi:hypothetical protein
MASNLPHARALRIRQEASGFDDAALLARAQRKLRRQARLAVRNIARRPLRRTYPPQTLPAGDDSASHSVFRVLVSAVMWGHKF